MFPAPQTRYFCFFRLMHRIPEGSLCIVWGLAKCMCKDAWGDLNDSTGPDWYSITKSSSAPDSSCVFSYKCRTVAHKDDKPGLKFPDNSRFPPTNSQFSFPKHSSELLNSSSAEAGKDTSFLTPSVFKVNQGCCWEAPCNPLQCG